MENLDTIPPETVEKVNKALNTLAEINAALLASDPKLPTHLYEIHAHLKAFPEILYLLPEEGIATIVEAGEKVYMSSIAVPATSRIPSTKKPKAARKIDFTEI
jgi:hypothetical protein